MKKIARIVDSQLVAILTFADDAQNLSEEFALKREDHKFDHISADLGGFIRIYHRGLFGLMASDGKLIIPIKFKFIRVTPNVIVVQEDETVTFYRYSGEVWELDVPYRLVCMDDESDCAVVAQCRNSKIRAIYSFAEGKFLFKWTKNSRRVGRHWFFEDNSGERKFVCAYDALSKFWPAEEIRHFSYAAMVKIDGEYKVYTGDGLITNLGE